MSKRIVALGECMLEMSNASMHQYHMGFAGDSFNTAFYLAQLSSHQVYFASAIGTDPYSDEMHAFMQSNDIHTDHLLRDPNRLSGLYFIKTDRQGERTFYYYRENAAAKFYFDHLSEDNIKSLSQFDMLYTTGISLAVLNHKEALINLSHRTKAQGGLIAFDNNYRPRLWPDVELARQHIDSIHTLCDIVFLTYEDEVLLYQDKSIEETIERYQDKTLPLVVMTNGAEKTVLIEHGEVSMITPPTVRNVIDTTCAGDSFNAGFLKAYLTGLDAKKAVSYGHVLASHVIQYQGALMPKDLLQGLNLR